MSDQENLAIASISPEFVARTCIRRRRSPEVTHRHARDLRLLRLLRGVCFPLALLLVGLLPASAATSVRFGTITQITGPADLDLTGDFVYAINFSADDPVRTVRGVRFLPDTQAIPGAQLTGPQNVTPWQTKPEFGSGLDANQLEEILADIRWANTGSSERLRASLTVTAGEEYKLQILISANGNEDRRWDIRVAGREAVDEITSLGASPGQTYLPNRATLYTCQFIATTSTALIEMGQLFGANDGGDRNPIWQALTLERITIPPTPEDITLSATQFFPTQTSPLARVEVLDRRAGATHSVALVPGEGDRDNARFRLAGANLLPNGFDFASVPPETTFSLRIRATDDTDARRVLEKVLTLTVVTPDPPTRLVLDASSLDSGAGTNAFIAHVRAVDPDLFDQHDLRLVAGNGDRDNSAVFLANSELRLTKPLAEGQTELRVRLRATDLAGLSVESEFVLRAEPARVRINEILASELPASAGANPYPGEWLELFNPGSHFIDLTGWHLTDDPEDLGRWTFPIRLLPPGGYLVVLADASTTPPTGSTNLHANFSLSSGGEWLGLVRPDARTVVTNLDFPPQFPGVAFGVGSDERLGALPIPTPGAPNGPIADGGENVVSFSVPHGFFTNSFSLELGATLPGSVIRYTLDGTVPTATSGTSYAGPFTVSPNTTGGVRGVRIVRAVALHPRAAFSRTATSTYLFINGVTGPTTDGVVAQTRFLTSITRHTTYGPLLDDALLALPALCVVMSGGPTQTERVASLELFDPAGQEEGFQIDCGIGATGTTSLGSPKLSMAARFRTVYGKSTLKYPVFRRGSMVGGRSADEFNELRLRSHSHDTFFWLGTRENPPVPYGSPAVNRSGDAQLARNPWIDEMQIAMGQPGKRGRQVHFYLNGAYHGIYHIHEHADEDFMASYYGGGREDYHYTGAATTGSVHADGHSWSTTWGSVKSSLGTYIQAKRWIDVTNLCDYMVLSFYAGNDWDWSAQHNWSAAGPRLPDRGGWKFFQQDSDICLQDVGADCTDQTVPDGIFHSLMRFPDFKVLFRDRAAKHLLGEGMLTPKKAADFYDARMNEISTAIVAETARWQPSSSISALPWDRDQEWTNEWRYLRNTFFPLRTARVLQQLKARGWWALPPPDPSVPEGRVPAGQLVSFTTTTGTVYFTTDGSDPRLPGGAINPKARARITGTTERILSPAGSVWRFLDDGTEPAVGWTSFDFDDSRWKSGVAEIGYGDGNEITTAAFVDTDPVTVGVQKNITTYFRRAFDVTDILSLRELKLRLRRDDGAVVYLNGREIWRVNLPEGAVTSTTRALTGIGDVDEVNFLEQTIGAATASLRSTGNVLAVEMHQQAPESSDISFDFELIGTGTGVITNADLVINGPTVVRARTYTGSDWSALADLFFVPEGTATASSTNLTLSEIHYRPLETPDAEFLEFLNTSSAPVDVSGVTVTNGIRFTFPRNTILTVGERIVIVKDLAAFDARYLAEASPYRRSGVRRLGPWDGSLSNEGETMDVQGADGTPILSCRYGTADLWPGRAGGKGSSLEVERESGIPEGYAARSAWLSFPSHWRPSSEFHGSPGEPGLGPDNRVVVNEIVAEGPEGIELLNVSGTMVDVSGWFVSDSSEDYRKYRLPTGLSLSSGARWVLGTTDFNSTTNPLCLVPFELNSQGDDIFLVQADLAGALIRFVDRIEFGRSPQAGSIGRFPDGTGPLVLFDRATLGEPNVAPRTGFEAWASGVFPNSIPAESRGHAADPDGDGLSNFAEYAFVTPPDDAENPPILWLSAPRSQDGWIGVTYRVRTLAPDVRYRLDVSVDLRTWAALGGDFEEASRVPLPDGASAVTVRIRVPPNDALGTANPRFVRVRAE